VAPSGTVTSAMDPLSHYLSAAFEPIRCVRSEPVRLLFLQHYLPFALTREPILWPPESALRWPLPATELAVPIQRQEVWNHNSPIAFIKLLMHRPHFHPDNTSQEVRSITNAFWKLPHT
jgi:hypothetical protein